MGLKRVKAEPRILDQQAASIHAGSVAGVGAQSGYLGSGSKHDEHSTQPSGILKLLLRWIYRGLDDSGPLIEMAKASWISLKRRAKVWEPNFNSPRSGQDCKVHRITFAT